jgi:hypothetical protein
MSNHNTNRMVSLGVDTCGCASQSESLASSFSSSLENAKSESLFTTRSIPSSSSSMDSSHATLVRHIVAALRGREGTSWSTSAETVAVPFPVAEAMGCLVDEEEGSNGDVRIIGGARGARGRFPLCCLSRVLTGDHLFSLSTAYLGSPRRMIARVLLSYFPLCFRSAARPVRNLTFRTRIL